MQAYAQSAATLNLLRAFAQVRERRPDAVLLVCGTGEEEQQLARSLLVWPDVTAFDQLREAAPAVVTGFGQELLLDASAGLSVTRDPR